MEIARWETESCSPRYHNVSRWRNDQDQLYIYLCPKDVSLVHISQRIKVENIENPDLAKSSALWRKPSISNQGGRCEFYCCKGVPPVGTSNFYLLLCHLPFRSLHPATWHLHLRCWNSAKRKTVRGPPKGPASLHSSPGQASRGTSGEPLLEEVIQKPRWPGGPL